MSLWIYLTDGTEDVYERNITHNLGKMAAEAGLYDAMWRPDEHDWKKASDIESILAAGLCMLIQDPKRFEALGPENGWGTYDGLVETTMSYLKACRSYPEAAIRVSR